MKLNLSNKRKRTILATLLTLVSVIGGSSLFSVSRAQRQQQKPATPSTQNQTPAPVASPTATPTPDETILPEDEVLTVESDLTNILFSATDKDRRFFTNLKKEDVRVYEDNAPQEIFTFAQQVDLPLTLAILIDTSQSQERTLPEEKAAARSFSDAVLRGKKDEAAVVSFTGETTLEQGLTGNIARVRQGIESIRFIPASGTINGSIVGTPPISGRNQMLAGSTAIWDAIDVTSREVLTDSPPRTRRAIILLTDGINTSGTVKFHEAVQSAIKAETQIYCIGIGDDYVQGVDEGSLRKLAERTGGRAYFPRSREDLQKAFDQIQRELREQYLLAYSTTNKTRDGSFRKIRMEVVNPELKAQKLKLTYREGYFAKSTGGSSATPASSTGKSRRRQ